PPLDPLALRCASWSLLLGMHARMPRDRRWARLALDVYALVGQDRLRPGSRPATTNAGDTHFGQHGNELRAVAALPGGDHHGHHLAPLFAGQMGLGGPAAPRSAEPV